jgi:NRPS condensation-like uncharacterized protein
MQNTNPDPHHVVASLSAGDKTADTLFPQRFTPFEFYFWLEDRPDYPSVFSIRLECRGSLDREAFQRAFQLAIARHPFLSARIERDRHERPIWVAGEPAPIRWTDDSSSANKELMASNSCARLQAQVSRDGDKTVLSFAFHHVAVDGMGAFQFITDLMVAYAHGCSGDAGQPPWRPLDRELLRDRDGHRLFNRKIKVVDLIRVARVSLPLLFRRAAVVSDRGKRPEPGCPDSSAPDFLVHTLTVHETAKLSRVARKLSVRVHDLLVRDYFIMLVDWNRNTSESRRPIRVLVPTNLRRKEDYRMPAANVFGYTFLSRRSGDCEHRARLLDSIRSQMAAIKRSKWGLYHEAGLRMFCIWPAVLRWSLNRKWPFATAIFTNLNAGFDHIPLPWRDGRRVAGDLVLETGYGAGPISPETRVSVAVHSYAGRMSISMRCDKQSFDAQQQRALLKAYLDQVQMTIDSES